MKDQAIQASAKEMAKHLADEANRPDLEKALAEYLLGENDDVIGQLENLDPALKDKIAFSMRQFTIFLPLCLNAKEGSRYRRSDDGSKTTSLPKRTKA